MKLYRNAIILVIIVALLGGAYFLVSKNKAAGNNAAAASTSASADTIKLTNYTTDDVASLTIKNGNETYVINKKGLDFVLASPTGINTDSSALNDTVINAATVLADKLVEKNATDLARYGLDKPVIVTLKLKSGKEKTLEFGSLTPTKGGYYVKAAGENTVYVVGSYTGEKLIFNRNALKSKTLFTFSEQGFSKLSMERGGKNVFSSEVNAEKSWVMTQPIKGSMDTSALSPMFTALAGTTVKDFVSDPQDLAKYGLDKPAYEFDFTTTQGAFKLLLGNEDSENSTIYAKLAGRDDVFTIDSSTYTFLDKPLKEIADIFAYIVNIDKVKTIDLTMDGKTTHMTLDVYKGADGKQDADKDKFTVDGKDASGKNKDDKQPFRDFYQSLIGIGLDEIQVDGHPTGTPDVSIKYTLTSGSTMKVDYISKDSNYYYVMRNGQYAGILVEKSKVDFGVVGMKNSFKTMMDFLAKQK